MVLSKKIGILTYPLNNNYGCYLQSYALLHFLQRKGFDVEYINRRHNKPSWKTYLGYAIKTICKNVLTFKWTSPILNYEWHYMMKKGALLYPFFENNIVPHTEPIYTTKKLKAMCKQYDVIIVGSDQVWRAEILSNIEDYFLGFIKDPLKSKIAYAASFGKDDPGYTSDQVKSCGEALTSFKAVSVREEIGIKLISEYGWNCKDCKVVLDPTMLLQKEDYSSLLNTPNEKRIIFAYILDETSQKQELLNTVSNQLSLECVNILNGSSNASFIYPSVEDWLRLIRSASFVITDSFHGAVFSIIFNIPFAVIINRERGSARFKTLLNMFDLSDRVVPDDYSIEKIIKTDIDWLAVNDILSKRREDSMGFLLNNLN